MGDLQNSLKGLFWVQPSRRPDLFLNGLVTWPWTNFVVVVTLGSNYPEQFYRRHTSHPFVGGAWPDWLMSDLNCGIQVICACCSFHGGPYFQNFLLIAWSSPLWPLGQGRDPVCLIQLNELTLLVYAMKGSCSLNVGLNWFVRKIWRLSFCLDYTWMSE